MRNIDEKGSLSLYQVLEEGYKTYGEADLLAKVKGFISAKAETRYEKEKIALLSALRDYVEAVAPLQCERYSSDERGRAQSVEGIVGHIYKKVIPYINRMYSLDEKDNFEGYWEKLKNKAKVCTGTTTYTLEGDKCTETVESAPILNSDLVINEILTEAIMRIIKERLNEAEKRDTKPRENSAKFVPTSGFSDNDIKDVMAALNR